MPDHIPNGLGAWWFPSWFRNWLTKKSETFFDEAAWIKHDIGYARGVKSRKHCDKRFVQAMLRDASKSNEPVKTALLALFFWSCVRIGGGFSYNKKGKHHE